MAAYPLVATHAETDGYAVLLEVEIYSSPSYVDTPTGHANRARLHELLSAMGWQPENMFIREDEAVTEQAVIDAFEWLGQRVESDDVVLFYVGAHGSYIFARLSWTDTFPPLWRTVATDQKVLLVDSCMSGLLLPKAEIISTGSTTSMKDLERDEWIAISHTGSLELGWWGVKEEGLPILGSPFLHYFASCFSDKSCDANDDGFVSVEEAFASACAPTKAYYRDVIFAVPEFRVLFEESHERLIAMGLLDPNDFPNPQMVDLYLGDLILDLSFYTSR